MRFKMLAKNFGLYMALQFPNSDSWHTISEHMFNSNWDTPRQADSIWQWAPLWVAIKGRVSNRPEDVFAAVLLAQRLNVRYKMKCTQSKPETEVALCKMSALLLLLFPLSSACGCLVVVVDLPSISSCLFWLSLAGFQTANWNWQPLPCCANRPGSDLRSSACPSPGWA